MSYILDALKKAERERGAAQVPTLMTVHEPPGKPSSYRFWIVSVSTLLAAAALLWLTIPMMVNKETSGPAASLPELQAVRTEPAHEEVQAKAPSIEPPRSVVPSGNELPREISTAAKLPSAHIPSVEAHGKMPVPDAGTAAIPKAPAPEIAISSARAAHPEPAPKAPATAVESAARPASLREAMAEMNITILSYADEPSERMVFISDRKYVEGDYVDGRYLVERITAEGVVLNYQGERAMLRPK